MFRKREPQQSTKIVSAAEWDDLQADLRGLKRLASITEETAARQAQNFAQALDVLDKRTTELLEAVDVLGGHVSDADSRACSALNLLDGMAGALKALSGEIASLRALDLEFLPERDRQTPLNPARPVGLTAEQERPDIAPEANEAPRAPHATADAVQNAEASWIDRRLPQTIVPTTAAAVINGEGTL